MTELELLQQHIANNWISEEQAKLINQLTNLHFGGKGEIMEICVSEEDRRKMDTAYPSPYADEIRKILPTWKGHYNAFSYVNNRIYGEMTNIAELFTEHVINTFKK